MIEAERDRNMEKENRQQKSVINLILSHICGPNRNQPNTQLTTQNAGKREFTDKKPEIIEELPGFYVFGVQNV